MTQKTVKMSDFLDKIHITMSMDGKSYLPCGAFDEGAVAYYRLDAVLQAVSRVEASLSALVERLEAGLSIRASRLVDDGHGDTVPVDLFPPTGKYFDLPITTVGDFDGAGGVLPISEFDTPLPDNEMTRRHMNDGKRPGGFDQGVDNKFSDNA